MIYIFNYYILPPNIGLVFISSKWQRASKAADKLEFLYFLLLAAASFLVLSLTPLQQPGLLLGPDSGKDCHKEQLVLQDKLKWLLECLPSDMGSTSCQYSLLCLEFPLSLPPPDIQVSFTQAVKKLKNSETRTEKYLNLKQLKIFSSGLN